MADAVRVLRVIARLNMGGPALHVSYLTAGLQSRGYETTLVAGSLARGEGSMAFVAEEHGVEIVQVPQLSREISPLADAQSIAHRIEGVVSADSELVELVWIPIEEAQTLDMPAVTAVILNSTIADACPLDYPAGDVTLQFREVPKGNILQTETFSGPWGVFRLLKHPNVKSVTREANKWTIEYAVTDANKKTYSLWLVLDFKASVPDLKEWPVPPAKR